MSSPKNVLVDLWLAATVATPLIDDAVAGSGVTTDEFAIYGLVVDLGPLSAADLVRTTGLAPTTLSGLLSRCERRGHLRRVPSPTDRRSRLIELTEAGMSAYVALVPALMALLTRLEAELRLPQGHVRAHLQALDDALRRLRGIDARPYRVEEDPDGQALPSAGPPLTPAHEQEVRRYIEWLRHRDLPEAAAPA
ncbi:MAG TPA: MarR family transcriptional regulator [Euzebya sp.]|nr:MarR family transcriptional regulator [Euzebya sp.]